MVKLVINGQNIAVDEGTTIMEAAEKVGIHIPHLCYLKDLNEIALPCGNQRHGKACDGV